MKKKPKLTATEGRLNSVIAGWFSDQYNNNVPKQTLGRRIIESLEVMPDEFFEYVNSLQGI